MKHRDNRILRLIALFRFLKAFFLILGGIGALNLMRPGVMRHIATSLAAMPFVTRHEIVERGIATATHLPARRFEELAIAAFLYAALFITEAIGLWLGKIWAEWLTIVATASFIPFEVYEIVRRFTVIRVAVVVANAAILAYLIYRRTHHRRAA